MPGRDGPPQPAPPPAHPEPRPADPDPADRYPADPYPADKARGGTIVLRAGWMRAIFIVGLAAAVVVAILLR